ncbi:MAG: ABC transporter permease subunit [Chloroflexota bacterium]
MNFMAVFRKEMLEQWRTYRLLIVAAVLAAFGLASPLLAKFTPEMLKAIPDVPAELLAAIPAPTVADAITQYVKNMSQFGILLALLMTMGVVVQEKERGTAAFFLTRPVSRGTFLLAKFAALTVTFAVSLTIASLGCWYYTYVLFEPLAWGPFLALNGLMLVVFLAYVALSLLGSTIARTQGVAVGLAFFALIVVGGIGSLPRLGDYFPGRLFGWGATLMMDGSGTAWPAFGISLGIIVIALLVACIIFRRQEV